MTRSLIFAVLLGHILLLATPAETVQSNSAPTAASVRLKSGGSGVAPELKRFDLDFPGGTPEQLGAAISNAMGRHLNLVIPSERSGLQLMPIKVQGVTVVDLLSAIQVAASRQIPVVNTENGRKSVSFQTLSIGFRYAEPYELLSDNTVWSLMVDGPSPKDLELISDSQLPAPVCQYYQLASYLEDHTIEDITTAIQTGWKMLKVDPVPQLRFHKETKLLIAVGSEYLVNQIPQVLIQLRMDNTGAVKKIASLLTEIAETQVKKESGWEQKKEYLNNAIFETVKQEEVRTAFKNPTDQLLHAPKLP